MNIIACNESRLNYFETSLWFSVCHQFTQVQKIFPFRLCQLFTIHPLLQRPPKSQSNMKFTPFNIACYILVSLYSILPSVLSLQKAADPFCDRSRCDPTKPIKILLIQRFRAEWAELNAHHVTGGVARHTATITFHYLFSSINLLSRTSYGVFTGRQQTLTGGCAPPQQETTKSCKSISYLIPVESYLFVIHLNLFLATDCPFFKGE